MEAQKLACLTSSIHCLASQICYITQFDFTNAYIQEFRDLFFEFVENMHKLRHKSVDITFSSHDAIVHGNEQRVGIHMSVVPTASAAAGQ